MKKLTLSILALLALGASAQSRHYVTEQGLVTTSSEGVVETRVIEIMPVELIQTIPLSLFLEAPGDEPRRLYVRPYQTVQGVDTADTSDELYDTRNMYYEMLYETETDPGVLE